LVQLHRYAHDMQQEMKEQVQAAKPEFVVMVDINSSWLPEHGSETSIFDWCDDFVRHNYELVGAAYIPTHYEWGRDVGRHPGNSQVAVFTYERKDMLDVHPAKT
jgi:hypothetical protein